MPAKSDKRKFISTETRDYWNNLYINVDSFWDNWEGKYKSEFERKIKKEISESGLKEILELYNIQYKKTKTPIIKIFSDNVETAIELFCIIRFSLNNPKAYARILKIPPIKDKTNRERVIIESIKLHQKSRLADLFLVYSADKLGDNHFTFNLTGDEEQNFEEFRKILDKSRRFLKSRDKQQTVYHLRHSFDANDKWYFSFLKKTGDDIISAIPNNKRVIRGQYFYLVLDKKNELLNVKTRSKEIAYNLRDYISLKGTKRLYFKHSSSTYTPTSFFDTILQKSGNVFTDEFGKEIILTDVGFRKTNLNIGIDLHDPDTKHKVLEQIVILKEQGHLALNDISEFKYLKFNYNGLEYKVNIVLNKWGQCKLILSDSNKPKIDLENFQKAFIASFNIEFKSYLNNANAEIDKTRIINTLLNKKTIEANNIPEIIENELTALVRSKIILKPINCAKRRCENDTCRQITWVDKECPKCGSDLIIEGQHIDINLDEKGIKKVVFNELKKIKTFEVKSYEKQINRKKYTLIDIYFENKSITIYICNSSPSTDLVNYFKRSASPLLIILSRFKESLMHPIINAGFSCLDLSTFLTEMENSDNVEERFIQFIKKQNHEWYQRILKKGYESYNRIITRTNDYGEMDFETDTYNILQELFIIGDRLGGKMTGVKAPDGIVVINPHSKSRSKFCFAWDCKYSVLGNGYELNDDKAKHRFYINTLNKNDKVKFYGGLKTYAIISQNMNLTTYQNFYNRLTKRFRWKGNIVFIDERIIIELYRFYKENQALISSNPEPFYRPVSEMFSIIWKVNQQPFPIISGERLKSIVTRVKNGYEGKAKDFDFERNEFDLNN